jgi:hypothetical protein
MGGCCHALLCLHHDAHSSFKRRGRSHGLFFFRYNTKYNNATGKFDQIHSTKHEATAVVKGVKWAANKWIHVDDFVNNWRMGNTM